MHPSTAKEMTMSNPKTLIRAAGAGVLALAALAGTAQAATSVYVQIAPPAPLVEAVPIAPPGRVWVPGHYEWNGHRYHWTRGYFVAARPGYDYRAANWVQRGDRWIYEPGGWVVLSNGPGRHGQGHAYGHERGHGRDSDHDGVPNRFDRHPNNPNRR
jgi:hypothetical protein